MRESGRVSMGFSGSWMELAEVEGMPLSPPSRVLGGSSMLGAVEWRVDGRAEGAVEVSLSLGSEGHMVEEGEEGSLL